MEEKNLITFKRWTFPINEKSQYGTKYTVGKGDADILKNDEIFMNTFRYKN